MAQQVVIDGEGVLTRMTAWQLFTEEAEFDTEIADAVFDALPPERRNRIKGIELGVEEWGGKDAELFYDWSDIPAWRPDSADESIKEMRQGIRAYLKEMVPAELSAWLPDGDAVSDSVDECRGDFGTHADDTPLTEAEYRKKYSAKMLAFVAGGHALQRQVLELSDLEFVLWVLRNYSF